MAIFDTVTGMMLGLLQNCMKILFGSFKHASIRVGGKLQGLMADVQVPVRLRQCAKVAGGMLNR